MTVRIIKITTIVLLFILLTVLTQIGGLVLLLSLSTHAFINKKISNRVLRGIIKPASFLALYTIVTFLVIPVLAKPFGRVPLPLTEDNHLQPLNFLTCFLNRHYTRPALQQTAIAVAKEMDRRFPGTVVNYLDAGFPFINRFPLIPHLSHNDGKKLDLAFCYIDTKTGQPTNDAPSPVGYGISEEPGPGEANIASACAEKGYWQYSLLKTIIPQSNKQHFAFDAVRTKALVNCFTAQPAIGKIFIEPHLKVRLQLTNDKVRFHGCQAVRHDDHIHVQLYSTVRY